MFFTSGRLRFWYDLKVVSSSSSAVATVATKLIHSPSFTISSEGMPASSSHDKTASVDSSRGLTSCFSSWRFKCCP